MNQETILEGLEHCRRYGSLSGQNCSGYYEYTDDLSDIIKTNDHRKDCPYGKCKTGCVVTLISDATKLIRELTKQPEAVEPIFDVLRGAYHCGDCKRRLILVNSKDDRGRLEVHYCTHCGKQVKWNEGDH